MDDDGVDIGTTEPEAGREQRLEASLDKAARDAEFALFYTADMPRLVGFVILHGARPSVAAELAQDAMTEAYRN